MNSKYALTNDFKQKVLTSMDSLERQVYKPADTSKNFVPPSLPGGEKIVSAVDAEAQNTADVTRQGNNNGKLDDATTSDILGLSPMLGETRGRNDSGRLSNNTTPADITPKTGKTPASVTRNAKGNTFTTQMKNVANDIQDRLASAEAATVSERSMTFQGSAADKEIEQGKSVEELERQRN